MKLKVSSCLQVRKLGMLLASSGLFLKAMPELSDISRFEQVQKELIRISPKSSFDLYSREHYIKATFPLNVLGQGKNFVSSVLLELQFDQSCASYKILIISVFCTDTILLFAQDVLLKALPPDYQQKNYRTGLLREQYLSSVSCLNSKYINSKTFHLDRE